MDSRNNIVGTSEEQCTRNSQWKLDTPTSSESRDLDISNKHYLSTGLDLHVVQKKERTACRPIIPATKCEKFTYIRSYVSYTSRTDALGIRFIDYNRLFWHYLQGAFLKTLPSCYLYLFLGSYAPHHHLFLTKMAPLLHGLNIVWILIGVLQLCYSTYVQVLCLDFFISGIIYQRPWNRCINSYYSLLSQNGIDRVNISCLTLDQFIARTKNISLTTYDAYFYDPAAKENIQVSHFFNAWFRPTLSNTIFFGIDGIFLYYNIIWITSSLLINQIFKRSIWKMLHVAHWILTIFFACVLLFLGYFSAVNVNLSKVILKSSLAFEKQTEVDLEFLTESMTAPPVLHILTSRSKDEVKLSTDSALILTSNTLFYLLRAYVLDKLLRYCVYIANNAQWQLVYRETNIFFLWPIFFSSIGLDSVITIPFSILIFVVDFLTFVITHHFLIEVIICEWQLLKRWHAALILFILTNLHNISDQWNEIVNWLILYAIRAATSTELLIITFLYPLSRLLEDITFHNGIAASFVAVLSLRMVFLYYFIKFLHWSTSWLYEEKLPMAYRTGILIALFLIMLHALLIKFYNIVIISKKDWKLIFVPIVDWGPFDLTLRLLRKKFDSSKYIASQAPRELSRYLIQKAEPKSYKLDIRYDLQRK